MRVMGVTGRSALIGAAMITALPLTVSPALARTDLDIVRWQNGLPFSGRCSTAVVKLYNPTRKPVVGVYILWKADYRDTWRWRKGSRLLSWQYTPVTVNAFSSRTFRRYVCADWSNPGGMDVKPVRASSN